MRLVHHSTGGQNLPKEDDAFMARMLSYFGLRRVALVRDDRPRSDIAIQLGHGATPRYLIGNRWRKNRVTNAPLAHSQLVHESLHAIGFVHSPHMRKAGFYSRDRRRDVLSRKVYEDIMTGTPKFAPKRFGLSAPTGMRD